jgi:hypothetical protein
MASCSRLVISALIVLLPLAAHAASNAPAQLRGKSISVSWSEGRHQTSTEGQSRVTVVHTTFVIYVSENGRLFSQSHRATMNSRGQITHSTAHSKTKGDAIHTANSYYKPKGQFVGRTFVSQFQYESGARRLVLTFDESFGSCQVSLSFGKEDGAPGIVSRGSNGKLYMVDKVDVSGTSCAIRSGNALAS